MTRTISVLLLVLGFCVVAKAQANVPNLSGQWAFKSGENTGIVTMNITQDLSKIAITEVYRPKRNKDDRLLTYNTDGSGETNAPLYGQGTVKSRTKWERQKLSTSFVKTLAGTDDKTFEGTEEVRNEWTLSKDGQTLTIKSIFVNRRNQGFLSSPRDTGSAQDLSWRTYQRTSKQVFKKVQ